MAVEEIMERMTFILLEDDLYRITIKKDENGMTILEIDVHQMKVSEVYKLIKYIIIMYKFAFKLNIIHGYKHGTAIKEMLLYRFQDDRISSKIPDPYNPGMTEINVLDLYGDFWIGNKYYINLDVL